MKMKQRVLVTGGGGFLGEALVRRLVQEGYPVRVFARGEYPALAALGVETVRGDVRDAFAVALACADVEIAFHTAAKAGGWGDPQEYEGINVHGTRNVLAACARAGVRGLVYTSSPSVVHDGADIEGGDERLPYARRFTAAYPRTKARAEQAVRAAADGGLRTVSLRPHFIWGPGDHHLLPRLVERARAGKLRRVGRRDVLTDTTYIDNCVDAHLLAAERLREGAPVSGRAYFISDGAPVGVWTMADRLLGCAGLGPVRGAVPAWVASGVGAGLEAVHGLFAIEREPLMTRFGASQLSHAQWFDIGAAQRDLGYVPRVTREEGLARLRAWCGARAG